MDAEPLTIVAHRAGNDPDAFERARRRGHAVIEVDVHVAGGRLEVRHAKRLRGTGRLWERWHLLPPDTMVHGFEPVVTAASAGGIRLLVDLKGFTRRLPTRVLRAVGDAPIIVASRQWHLLRHFTHRPGTVRLASAASRVERWLLLRRWAARDVDGVALPRRLVDEAVARAVRRHKRDLYVWGITDLSELSQLASWGVTAVIVDEPVLADRTIAELWPHSRRRA